MMGKKGTRINSINIRPVFLAFSITAFIFGSGFFLGIGYAGSSKTTLPKADVDVRNVNDADEWETVQMRVTAYCPCTKCCGEYAQGITASGHKINQGDNLVAADKKFSFGTKMIIPGYGSSEPVEVLDRGGAIRGNRLDVFFATHQEALEWGVRYLDVKILRQ
jgi:3D (Asp-Asp-Asp) domain-containing protein